MRAAFALWSQDVASFAGDEVTFGPTWSWPKPMQRPWPPIHVGAPATAATFRAIVELGAGWMPMGSLAHPRVGSAVAELRQLAADAGVPAPIVSLSDPGRGWGRELETIDPADAREQLKVAAAAGINRVIVTVPDDADGASAAFGDLKVLAAESAQLHST
jgi:hypothetical protein